jgi:hypothetical protein
MACYGVRRKAWMIFRIGAALGLLGVGLGVGRAAEKETRVFNIKIDDKPAGYHQMTISRLDDHTTTVDSRADVSVSYLIKTFKYTYRGTERWVDGRLIQLMSETNDDGTQYQVLVQVDGDKLRVRVNGKESTTRQDVWTTTYWQLPPLQSPNQAVALLDCDTGKDLRGNLRYVGMEPLLVGGQTQNCAHYQIREVHVDVWYDAQKRLVRQASLDDGHRVLLELARIDRQALLPKP